MFAQFFTLPNTLTFLRAPLALLFIKEHASIRILATILAMITDVLDGYFARKHKLVSTFGTVLDPLMDRFFVLIVFSILSYEGNLEFWQMLLMLSRDLVMFAFALCVSLFAKLKHCKIRATYWGKITTSCQFLFLLAICMKFRIPTEYFFIFTIFSGFLLKELLQSYMEDQRLSLHRQKQNES